MHRKPYWNRREFRVGFRLPKELRPTLAMREIRNRARQATDLGLSTLADALSQVQEDQVGNNEVEVFNLLHVVRRNYYAAVE